VTRPASWLRCYRCWSQNLEVQVHYEGIHWGMDGEVGIRMGRRIGWLVVERARRDGAEDRSDP
jgi:hypothetical protein